MVDQIVEVEITGPLAAADLLEVRRRLEAWEYKGRFDRYLINFTTPEMRRNWIDVRARVTNGIPELIVKHGEWGSGKRVETPVLCARDQFVSLVRALVAIGLKEGVGCRRIIDRFADDRIEFSIIE